MHAYEIHVGVFTEQFESDSHPFRWDVSARLTKSTSAAGKSLKPCTIVQQNTEYYNGFGLSCLEMCVCVCVWYVFCIR